ncbi:hypothetical protein D3Z36_11915 [Lachnospiraceae bacterium]|nr:hypothetical protein [Lachnospiraceae bacterium]
MAIWGLYELSELKECGRILSWNNRVTGCVDLIPKRMGVMPMKNHFDFKDLMTFGLFLLALLTFVFTFCK